MCDNFCLDACDSKRDYVFFIICSLLLAVTAAPFGVPSLVYTLRWGRALRSSKEGAKVQREQRQATDCILAGLVCVSVVFVGLVALLIVLNVVCFPFVRELKKVAKVEYYNAGEDKGSSQSMEVQPRLFLGQVKHGNYICHLIVSDE